MYVVFDTETTGVATKGAEYEKNYDQYPHIVSLSWKTSESTEVNDFIIKPEGYEIPKEASDIHGITTEIALEKGIPFKEVVYKFKDAVIKAEKVIGHNIYFDTSNIKANVIRMLIDEEKNTEDAFYADICMALDKKKRVDTMMKTIKFCAIPFSNGRGCKWPKLEELYFKLFNETFNAHNSKDDVLATERCYLKLIEIGII